MSGSIESKAKGLAPLSPPRVNALDFRSQQPTRLMMARTEGRNASARSGNKEPFSRGLVTLSAPRVIR